MPARRLSPADAALAALLTAGADARPAPFRAAAEVLADLKRRGLAVRVMGGVILTAAGADAARRLVGPPAESGPDVPGCGRVRA